MQPVLVVVKSADVANETTACAKSLRRSRNPAIKRDNVHMNAILSKAEARAAYTIDQPCRRRMAAAQRLNLDPSGGASVVDTKINYGQQNHRLIELILSFVAYMKIPTLLTQLVTPPSIPTACSHDKLAA